jgi:hypothetical protein
MLQLVVLFIALVIPVTSHADAIDEALARAGFIEQIKPDVRAYWEECSTRSPISDDSVVEEHEGSLRIVRKPHADEPKPEFSTRHIKYIWDNRGEFGGKLEAVWPDKHKKMLIKENVRSIIQAGGFLYVFTGLGQKGAVYRISNFDKEPEVSKVTLLPGSPLPLLDSRHKDTAFIIITNEGLLALRPYIGWLNVIDHHSAWEDLRPNSAVKVDDRLLVGMCPCVAVVEFHNNYHLKSIRIFAQEKTESGNSVIPCQ